MIPNFIQYYINRDVARHFVRLNKIKGLMPAVIMNRFDSGQSVTMVRAIFDHMLIEETQEYYIRNGYNILESDIIIGECENGALVVWGGGDIVESIKRNDLERVKVNQDINDFLDQFDVKETRHSLDKIIDDLRNKCLLLNKGKWENPNKAPSWTP